MTNPYKQAILDKFEALEESIRQAMTFIDKQRQMQEELKCVLESVEKGAKPVPEESEPPVEEVKLGQCPRCKAYPVDFQNVEGGLQCSSCWGMVWYDSTETGVHLRANDEEAKNV